MSSFLLERLRAIRAEGAGALDAFFLRRAQAFLSVIPTSGRHSRLVTSSTPDGGLVWVYLHQATSGTDLWWFEIKVENDGHALVTHEPVSRKVVAFAMALANMLSGSIRVRDFVASPCSSPCYFLRDNMTEDM